MAAEGIDVALLASLTQFGRRGAAIRETFLTPTIGDARTVAVLSEPAVGTPPLGWVFCHSLGLEQGYVEPLEVDLARALAAGSSRVLRFYCQGYGDSERLDEQPTLATHLRDTRDAVRVLQELGAARIGLVGTRFGGAVAALVAEEVDAGALVLVEPVVDGHAYLKNLVRMDAMSELALRSQVDGWGYGAWRGQRRADARPAPADPHPGAVELDGAFLDAAAVEEIEALRLTDALGTFAGASLVVQVARTARPRADLSLLAEHLRSRGGACTLETIALAAGEAPIGAPRYVGRGDDPDGVLKRDIQAQLSARLVSATSAWAATIPL
jgi:pimeloyl-ACP methyl ester carboxylesterase